MRKEIDEFKSNNGNVKFTQKEILMFVATKLEKMDDKLNKVSNSVAGVKTSQKYHWIAITTLGGCLLFIAQQIFM